MLTQTIDEVQLIVHVFYLGTSRIIWCSQNQDIVALSSCEDELMAVTTDVCQSI